MKSDRPWLIMIALLGLAAPAAAQEWRMAPEYDVALTSFDIEPHVIRLTAGEPVKLRFVNNSGQVHFFSAPAFFHDAQISGHDRRLVHHGAVRLAPYEDETIAFVPHAGRYKVTGDNLFRRVLGMSATIVVQ
jgi:hypothetical protein